MEDFYSILKLKSEILSKSKMSMSFKHSGKNGKKLGFYIKLPFMALN